MNAEEHFISHAKPNVRIELGRAVLPARTALALDSETVIQLDRAEAEPVDIYVDGRILARGETIVIDGRLGVRVTQVLSSAPAMSAAGTN